MKVFSLALGALLFSGCGPVAAAVITDGSVDVDGDGVPDGPGDEDPDGPGGEDPDADPDPDPDPEPGAVFGRWEGERVLETGRCEETMYEEGRLLSDGDVPEQFGELCSECSYFYELEISPGRVCGFPVGRESWRGIFIQGREATILRIDRAGRGEFDVSDKWFGGAEITPEGIFMEYEYSSGGGGGGVEVFGEASLIRTN